MAVVTQFSAKVTNKIHTLLNQPSELFLFLGMGIILIQMFLGTFNGLGSDFPAYYEGTRFFLTDWSKLYNYDYYVANNIVLFVYLPSFCLIMAPFAVFSYSLALAFWVIFTIVLAVFNVFLIYNFLTLLKVPREYVNISVILFAVYIQHYWNLGLAQRGELACFLLLLALICNEQKKMAGFHLAFNLLIAVIPYFLLIYAVYLLKQKNIRMIGWAIITFLLLNFPVLFVMSDFIDLFIRFNHMNSTTIVLDAVYPVEYNVIGSLWYLLREGNIAYLTLSSLVCLGLLTILILFKVDSQNFTEICLAFFLGFLFFNSMLHGVHIIAMLPLLILFGLKSQQSRWMKLSMAIGIVLILVPIPYALFELVQLGSISYLKRVVSYIFLLPLIKEIPLAKGLLKFKLKDYSLKSE